MEVPGRGPDRRMAATGGREPDVGGTSVKVDGAIAAERRGPKGISISPGNGPR